MSRMGVSLWLGVVLSLPGLVSAAVPVGGVEFKRGPVFAERSPAAERELSIGVEVFQQDQVRAGAEAFAIIRFEDDNKLAVRPNTQVTLASYIRQADGDVATVDLEKGGIRANIRKREGVRRTYHISAGVTEVTVDEAQFDLRHCGEDCAAEARELASSGVPLPEDAAGRVALLRGESWARSAEGRRRALSLSAPVYQGDRLQTGSTGVLMVVLRDGGRLSLEPDSTLELQNMPVANGRLQAAGARLVTGGLRALTGTLGREDPASVSVETPVATTGIRGTGFDLICEGSCVNESGSDVAPDPGAQDLADGLYSTVWKGAVFQRNDAGSFDLAEGEQQYIANRNSRPHKLEQQPQNLQRMRSPRPDQSEADGFDELIDANEHLLYEPLPGLYSHVYAGSLVFVVEGQEPVTIRAGHTVYIDAGGQITVVPGAPSFMAYDEACVGC